MAAAPLDRVKALLAALPREDQEELDRFLRDILLSPEDVEARETPIATLSAKQGGRTVTYTFRNEWIRCGKEGCKCANGAFHGPYTYKYWREEGRVRKKYVGKSPRAAGQAAAAKAAEEVKRPGGKARAGRARSGSAASSSGPTPPRPADP